MRFNDYELATIWLALLIEQKTYDEGSKGWFRHEKLIRKIEEKLRADKPDVVWSCKITKRPLLNEVNTD